MRVLIIEDEPDVGRLIELNLRDAGYEVRIETDGVSGLATAESGGWDLVVLDLALPGIDGLEICRRLRARPEPTAILMVTARSSELDRVLGLELGADDYLTKPFSIRELVARVKAMFRRMELQDRRSDVDETLVADGLTIDIHKRTVTRNDEPIDLTAKEFELLVHFAQNPGRVYTRAELLEKVWGYGHAGYDHTVNSHINRLRAKLEHEPANPSYILTVWGVGYKFRDDTVAATGRNHA